MSDEERVLPAAQSIAVYLLLKEWTEANPKQSARLSEAAYLDLSGRILVAVVQAADAERAAHAETKAKLEASVYEQRACHADKERLESTLREVRDAASLFRDYACHCAIINEGRGPKCGHCVMRDALARCDAVLNK